MKNKPFGNKIAKKFDIGDIVSWSDWSESGDGTYLRKKCHGVLIGIATNQLGEREVVFGRILPFQSKETVEIVITNLTKIETTY